MNKLSPEQIAASVTALALAISKNVNYEELITIALLFTQLGDTLATIGELKSSPNNPILL